MEIGIRLDDSVLTKGLNQDDVLAVEGDTVFAVRIPPCECLIVRIDPHHPGNDGEGVLRDREPPCAAVSGEKKRELHHHAVQ